MKRTIRKTWNIVSTVLVSLVVLLALLLVGARVFGLQVFTVLSGSMEPTYHTGSLIYVKKVDPYTIKAGQVITFMLDEDTIATHRVVAVVPDEEDASVIRFRTKGDANESEDGGLVHYKNVVGTPVFTIPYLGFVANYIQHPPGMYVAIAAGAVLLMLTFLPDVFAPEEQTEPRPAKEKAKRRRAAAEERAPRRVKPAAEDIPAEEPELSRTPAEPVPETEPAEPSRMGTPAEEAEPAAEEKPRHARRAAEEPAEKTKRRARPAEGRHVRK